MGSDGGLDFLICHALLPRQTRQQLAGLVGGDGVKIVPPGNLANVILSVVGNTLHFSFELPQGDVGPKGEVSTADMNNAVSNAVSGAAVVSSGTRS